MKNYVTDQSEEQKKKLFWKQVSVLNNAEVLLIQRGEIIDQFTKSNIIYTPEKTKKSFFETIEVSKDKLDSIKLKIFRNKNLSTTIDKERYTLSDVIDLVNKIDSKSIRMDEAINNYNDIATKKVKKLQN